MHLDKHLVIPKKIDLIANAYEINLDNIKKSLNIVVL